MSSQSQGLIPGNRLLEELGKLHMQLAAAQDAIRELQAQNAQLAKELRETLAKLADATTPQSKEAVPQESQPSN